MNVQYMTTPEGTKMAIVPADEFERIYEMGTMNQQDIADAISIESSWQEFVASGCTYIPVAYFDRVLDGEHPVRVYRQWRGFTIAELAQKANITVGYLSNIERGIKTGTVATYQKIAEVLDLPLDDIVPVAASEN